MFSHMFRSETRTTNAEYGEHYRMMKTQKLRIHKELLAPLHSIDSSVNEFRKQLAEFTSFKTIPTKLQYRDEFKKAQDFLQKWCTKLGLKYQFFDSGHYELEGERVPIPLVLLISMMNGSPGKKTVFIYSYADVKEPEIEKWQTDPFTLTEKDRIFYGAGIAGGKGALLCWLQAMETFIKVGKELPVNVLLIVEFMSQLNSPSLYNFLKTQKSDLQKVDYAIMCDSQWLGNKTPCIIYGAVGVIHFNLIVEQVADSGSDIKEDAKKLMDTICDDKGNVLIDGFYDHIEQVSPDEENIYNELDDFNVDDIRDTLPEHMRDWGKVKLLMHFWRFPSIFTGEIKECTCGDQTPSVALHFIVKIVPFQVMDYIVQLAKAHIKKMVNKLKIKNSVSLHEIFHTRPWREDHTHPHYQATIKAIRQIYKVAPNLIREDRRRDIIILLNRVIEKNFVFLPLAPKNSNIGEANENIPSKIYFENVKLLTAYKAQLRKRS